MGLATDGGAAAGGSITVSGCAGVDIDPAGQALAAAIGKQKARGTVGGGMSASVTARRGRLRPAWQQALQRLPLREQKIYHETFSSRWLDELVRCHGECILRKSELSTVPRAHQQ